MSAAVPLRGRNPMRILIPALIIDMLAFTCILPLFPSILTYYSREENRDYMYDMFDYGLKSFQKAINVPVNERYNNIWMRAETFTLFVLSRAIGGLSKANVNVATAIVSDVYKPEDNAKGMALIGISYSVGFLIGPMFGAYFSTMVPKDALQTTPALFSIILTCIHFALVAALLPETLRFEERKSSKDVVQKASQFVSPLDLFKFKAVNAPAEGKREMQRIGFIYFIYLFLYAGLEFTLPFLTHLRFNFDSMQQGKIYLFTGFLMLPIQGYVVRKTPMNRQKRVAELGILCIIPAFLIMAQATTLFGLYLGLFLYAIVDYFDLYIAIQL
ncbi:unnamed protein product [Nippostrongylus brasiliensis]|uniref:Tetracycline-efflux transporter, putative (inferred by orthology to a S. mansoni protein) n=1 Tax=Nippostrongylus brasiliensis TaxID=27835 RepID=A0A158R1T7_NIPBR|nr:unnamed protein product [Nippostrongylus brasiliensis]